MLDKEEVVKDEALFKAKLLYNCMKEEVWVYYLSRPVTEEFEDFIKCFGKLKYPMGKGVSFIKLETEDFQMVGNLGSNKLILTIKYTAATKIKGEFEKQLDNYLRR